MGQHLGHAASRRFVYNIPGEECTQGVAVGRQVDCHMEAGRRLQVAGR